MKNETTPTPDSLQPARPRAVLAHPLAAALLAAFVALAAAPAATAFPPFRPAVGIKVTVADTRLDSLEADLDLVVYTRAETSPAHPGALVGYPTASYPALDYGDGSSLGHTTLALASSGGGPRGTNVYRNLASFTHTYPARGVYTVTAADYCPVCFRGQLTYFPLGSPGSPTSVSSFDYVPETVIGNLAGRRTYTGTTSTPFGSYSVRYAVTAYVAVTDTAQVVLQSVLDIPTASTWGLLALGLGLALSGLYLLPRT